uniref:Cell division control protein 73 C-terminal domain-containing protein n=1 Tax=Dunaliella tertiolecta TaxID=3047 RepID=A0A7S3R426_DUNTE|mmetsp:Transcript_17883/g.50013  ORF Transcript_17883/g.50013 Transcript_17883/m.50013 type:complete len:557 (+) Transcript_17883:174-1844(+)|eukprot:CAMPEP_0202352816 /NCGR_PEP_ID=MMETSP1126-20121109/8846_1 /ASSEMBLY_ACC=CAM_ASM_000457 /TAXON_ID=3047 /ORGANISM="Dunaliella tertiolecta, Strain CCMP1320" /LENGTH=556 /DNA_ID=CAMNT_0048945081 /DNA_START=76 /DNA_END=1746 /DNA_ORIENTATION=-
MDPLTLLREFNVGQKLHEVQVVGDHIQFGTSYVFPRSAYTAFRGAKDYYQLESALFVVQQRQLPQPAYLTAAKSAGLVPVPFIDRRKLLEYLDGKTELQLDTSGALLSHPVPPSAVPDEGEPAQKKARLQDGLEPGVSDKHGQFERELRDRNTMLQAPTKHFKSILDIAKQTTTQLSSRLRQEQLRQQQRQKEAATAQAKQKQQAQQKVAAKPPPPPVPAQPARPLGRLERDSTTDQLKAMGGEAAANIGNMISIYGYAGTDKNGAAEPSQQQQQQQQEGPAASAPYDPDPWRPNAPPPTTSAPSTSQPAPSKPQPEHHHKPSKPPHPGSAPPKPHSSSSAARQHEKEKQYQLQKQKLKAQQQQQQAGHKPKMGAQLGKPGAPVSKPVRPIIIVPSGMTATITMFNARTFLEEGRFEPSAAAQARGVQKQTTDFFKRTALKPPGQSATYELTDKPPPKNSKDWERVAAVIVQGAKWQFKDWIFKGAKDGDLAETFQKVAGFYIHFADEKVPELVANWNIKCLGLTRERRHMDMTVALDFYRHLDAFLYSRRSNLAY